MSLACISTPSLSGSHHEGRESSERGILDVRHRELGNVAPIFFTSMLDLRIGHAYRSAHPSKAVAIADIPAFPIRAIPEELAALSRRLLAVAGRTIVWIKSTAIRRPFVINYLEETRLSAAEQISGNMGHPLIHIQDPCGLVFGSCRAAANDMTYVLRTIQLSSAQECGGTVCWLSLDSRRDWRPVSRAVEPNISLHR
jgi:hypothetical protein